MKNKPVFFIGIKGTGMASLAIILHNLGYDVSGSDIERHFFTEDNLRDLQIPIYDFDPENIKDNSTVIVGNAFLEDHPEVIAARNNASVKVYRYHEFVGELMKSYRTIGVSGSHGKTTTTTMLKDMLSLSKKTGYLIGDGQGNLSLEDAYFVVEACEFKRHFLAYAPDVAIMTNFEIDHVDYFKDTRDYLSAYASFAENVKELIVVWGDDPNYKYFNFNIPVWTYGFDAGNTLRAIITKSDSVHTVFDVYKDDVFLYQFDLPIVGDHLVLDALSVIGVGIYEAIPNEAIEKGLQNFTGAKRRYVVEKGKENIYIDDYAHHPTEIKVTLEATRKRFPGHKVVAVFKPHRVGRVYRFVDQFVSALSLADEVGLCPFTSIDDAEEGIDIDITYLQDRIPGSFVVEETRNDIAHLASLSPAVFVFMSSKDIYDLKDSVREECSD